MKPISAANIPLTVSRFRTDRSIPSFCDDTLAKPFVGGQCLVYKLAFSDGATWAVRLPVGLQNHVAVSLIVDENEILRLLETSNFPWSPRYIGEELEHNAVGCPFSVYEWIPGSPMSWTADFPPTRTERTHFINQLGRAHWSLLSLTRREGPHPESVIDHVTRVTDHRIVRICKGSLPSMRIRDCFYHRNLVLEIFGNGSRRDPRCMGHNDLAAQNIMVDQNGNITGILDWSFAAEEPFQLAAAMPRILRPRPGYEGPVQEQDHSDFVDALAGQTVSEQQEREFLDSLLEMYTSSDAEYLQKIIEAVGSKGAFQTLAQTFPCLDLTEHDTEMDDFLKRPIGSDSGLDEEVLRKHL